MEMHSVEFYKTTTKKKKKKKTPAPKCYPQWVLNPGPLTLLLCMLLSEPITDLLEVSDLYFTVLRKSNKYRNKKKSLTPLDPYIVMLY